MGNSGHGMWSKFPVVASYVHCTQGLELTLRRGMPLWIGVLDVPEISLWGFKLKVRPEE